MKYRKRIELVDAIQWDCTSLQTGQNNFAEIKKFCGNKCRIDIHGEEGPELLVGSGFLETTVLNGEWIVLTEDGKFSIYDNSSFRRLFMPHDPMVGGEGEKNRFG